MLQRFVAGTAIASIAVAVGALVLLLLPNVRLSPVTTIWCFVPLVWGVWAMCAPSQWVPTRLPIWGAILGLIAGLFAAFVLNIALRVVGAVLSVSMRGFAVIVAVVFYYILWTFVRSMYISLAAERPASKAAGAGQAK